MTGEDLLFEYKAIMSLAHMTRKLKEDELNDNTYTIDAAHLGIESIDKNIKTFLEGQFDVLPEFKATMMQALSHFRYHERPFSRMRSDSHFYLLNRDIHKFEEGDEIDRIAFHPSRFNEDQCKFEPVDREKDPFIITQDKQDGRTYTLGQMKISATCYLIRRAFDGLGERVIEEKPVETPSLFSSIGLKTAVKSKKSLQRT